MYNSKLILAIGLVIAGTLLTTTGVQMMISRASAAPPSPPPLSECLDCFSPMTDSQVEQLGSVLADRYGIEFPDTPTRSETLEIICEALEQGSPSPGLGPSQVNKALKQVDNISDEVRRAIVNCLKDLF